MQHESKLKFYGMREGRQEIEVLHKAPKKPVRKPTAWQYSKCGWIEGESSLPFKDVWTVEMKMKLMDDQ